MSDKIDFKSNTIAEKRRILFNAKKIDSPTFISVYATGLRAHKYTKQTATGRKEGTATLHWPETSALTFSNG